jgi:hypothetical protein
MPRHPAFLPVLAILAVAVALRAEEPAGNALGLMDAWLALQATRSAEFRADPSPMRDGATPAPGRLAGHSPLLGAFTYRPKAYGELNPRERAELLSDPGFRAFLASVRKTCDGPGFRADLPGRPSGHRDLGTVDLSPDEMLRPKPVWILVPP